MLGLQPALTKHDSSKTYEKFCESIIDMAILHHSSIQDPILHAYEIIREALWREPEHDFIEDASAYLNLTGRKPGQLYQQIKETVRPIATEAKEQASDNFRITHFGTGTSVIALANQIGRKKWRDTIFTCIDGDNMFFVHACYLQMCALSLRGSIALDHVIVTGRNNLTEGLFVVPGTLTTPGLYRAETYISMIQDILP